MNNPLRILETLEKHLHGPAEITLFGRSALALGFVNATAKFHSTQDVDGILPLAWLEAEDSHEDFWMAIQETNKELEPDGLYLTHLFRELDIIIQPDWLNHRKKLDLGFANLNVFHPGTIDLILTKMARCDVDDLHDIQFMLGQDSLTQEQLQAAFEMARVPDVPEIRELFQSAQPKVLALVNDNTKNS